MARTLGGNHAPGGPDADAYITQAYYDDDGAEAWLDDALEAGAGSSVGTDAGQEAARRSGESCFLCGYHISHRTPSVSATHGGTECRARAHAFCAEKAPGPVRCACLEPVDGCPFCRAIVVPDQPQLLAWHRAEGELWLSCGTQVHQDCVPDRFRPPAVMCNCNRGTIDLCAPPSGDADSSSSDDSAEY